MKICISASIKFKEDIEKISKILDELNISYYTPIMNLLKEEETDDMIPDLVRDHFEKINKSESIFVINPGGYVGNSVKVEIGYAKGAGKKVYFLEKTGYPELDCLADEFITIDDLGKLR